MTLFDLSRTRWLSRAHWPALALLGGLLLAPISGYGADPEMQRFFSAHLSADNETRNVDSHGMGEAQAVLDLETRTLTWTITFSGLTSEPTAVRLHGPAQPGANGIPMMDMTKGKPTSPIKGSAVLSEAQIQYMLSRWTYVNIETKRFPQGEIRGQFLVSLVKE